MNRQRPQRANMNLENRFRQLERRMIGHRTTPAPNPTAFVQLPWNSWTYERTDGTTDQFGTVSATVGDVLGQIRGRTGIPESSNLRIKVQSAQIWGTAASLLLPDINCAFYELAGETGSTVQNPRSNQRDIGTLNMPAKVGYVFPVADQKEIVGQSLGALKICDAIATSTGTDVTVRIQVLWQAENQP